VAGGVLCKKVVEVYDYVDSSIRMLARMFEKRLRGYRVSGTQATLDDRADW